MHFSEKYQIELPHAQVRGTSSSVNLYGMDNVVLENDKSLFVENGVPRSENSVAVGSVCGYLIPPFQRPVVWTYEQMSKFIESIFLGYDLGRIVYVCDFDSPFDGCIIDGLQRLTAIERFIKDEFTIFDKYTFSSLPRQAQRRFTRSNDIPALRIKNADEQQLREMYNRMNYGGTAHTENQRV